MAPPLPTGCTGTSKAGPERGLTLIELMVVMVLMGVLSAAVLVGLRDPDHQTLQRQGERLAAELEAARSWSRSHGHKLVWVSREGGFAIEGRAPSAPTQPWMHPEIEVQWDANAATRTLVLGPEPIIASQSVTLRLKSLQLKLATDGLGPFRVSAAP